MLYTCLNFQHSIFRRKREEFCVKFNKELFFGMILYHRPVSVWRILLAQFLVKLFVNIGCNTLWLNLLYKKAVLLILPERIISNLIMLPIDTLICYIVLKAVDRSVRPMFQEQNQNKISQ